MATAKSCDFLLWHSTRRTDDEHAPRPNAYVFTVDTNAASVKLELNGRPLEGGSAVHVPFFGQATFNVTYAPGNLTAKCMDSSGKTLSSYSVVSLAGPATSIKLSLDAPSASTGTGTHLVADGEDVAMVRATLYDSAGNFAMNSTENVTFTISKGEGKIWVSDPRTESFISSCSSSIQILQPKQSGLAGYRSTWSVTHLLLPTLLRPPTMVTQPMIAHATCRGSLRITVSLGLSCVCRWMLQPRIGTAVVSNP